MLKTERSYQTKECGGKAGIDDYCSRVKSFWGMAV
jgi:hypothetical protein